MFHKTQFSEVYISSSGRENFELKKQLLNQICM